MPLYNSNLPQVLELMGGLPRVWASLVFLVWSVTQTATTCETRQPAPPARPGCRSQTTTPFQTSTVSGNHDAKGCPSYGEESCSSLRCACWWVGSILRTVS